MPIEVEFFSVTGMLGDGMTGLLLLRHSPTTGLNGEYDIAVDPIDGPAQRLGIDFGVTHLDSSYGNTGAITYDLPDPSPGSDIREVLLNTSIDAIPVLTLRVVYNYETGLYGI